MKLRLLFFGLLAGILLSAMRAPKGLDWTQLQVVDAWTAAIFRAAALLAVALLLDPRRPIFRRGASPGYLLFSVFLGFSLHGFVVVTRFEPESRLGFGLLLIALTLGLRLLAQRAEARTEDPDSDAPRRVERAALTLAGIGLALSLETLAHQTRLLGIGLPDDDTVMAAMFLLLTFLGCIAFGRLFESRKLSPVSAGVGLALTAALTLQGLSFLSGMDRDALFRHLRAIGIDSSFIGGLRSSGALAGAAFVGTAFALGTTLSALRHPQRLAAVMMGGAVGLILRPAVVANQSLALTLPQDVSAPWAWQLGLIGVVLATLGGLVVVVLRSRGALRVLGVLLALGALGVYASRPLTVWSFSPWYVAELGATLVIPRPEGLLTVEGVPDGTLTLQIDRERMTPSGEEEEIDRLRIHWAFQLLDPVRRAAGVRLLVVGQLTPPRAETFDRLGVRRLDCTAPWYESMPAVEEILFEGKTPPGARISPTEAKRNLAQGKYDLVLALPAHGTILSPRSATYIPWSTTEAPVLGGLELPEHTLGVAWLDAAAPLGQRDLGQVMFAQVDFRHQSLGVIRGTPHLAEDNATPALFDGGSARVSVSIKERFGVLSRDRHHMLLRALWDRLALAAEGGERADLARGLAIHFRGQGMSSPFETLAQQVEFDEESLRAYYESARGKTSLDPFTRGLFEDLARVLTQKRLPDMVLAYLEGMAATFGPWPELDRAVGQAYVEFLEPDKGLENFDRVLVSEPYDVNLLMYASEVAARHDQIERAVGYVDRALEVQPGRHDLVRERAILQADGGDEEARGFLEELFREHPEDERLANYLHGEPRSGGGHESHGH